MPKIKRKTVYMPDWVADCISKRAEAERRSEAMVMLMVFEKEFKREHSLRKIGE